MNSEDQKQSNTLVIALLVALFVALIGLLILLAAVLLRGTEGEAAAVATPTSIATLPADLVDPIPTGVPVATVIVPTPAPLVPQGTVIARSGLNVRTGPGVEYPIIFRAPFGSQAEITGQSADGAWWVLVVPGAPGNNGWVSAEYVAAENVDNVPVVSAPPIPVTPTPVPPVVESFNVTPNPINVGDCTAIQWAVGGGAISMRIIKNGVTTLVEGAELSGQVTDCPNSGGAKSYLLEARNDAGETAVQEIVLSVQEVNPLANTNWTLSSMNVNQLPVPGTELSAFFGAEFALSGEGGCNAFSGSYSLGSSNTIAVGLLASGTAFCGGVVDQQEQLFFSLLQSAQSYEISGTQLILRSAGQEVLRFNQS